MKDITASRVTRNISLTVDAKDLVKRYDTGNLPCYSAAKAVHDYFISDLKENYIWRTRPFMRFNGVDIPFDDQVADYVAKVLGAAAAVGLSALIPSCGPGLARRLVAALKKAFNKNAFTYLSVNDNNYITDAQLFVQPEYPSSAICADHLCDNYSSLKLTSRSGEVELEPYVIGPGLSGVALQVFIYPRPGQGFPGTAEITLSTRMSEEDLSYIPEIRVSPTYAPLAWFMVRYNKNIIEAESRKHSSARLYQNAIMTSL